MSLYKPLYARFNFDGVVLEGEYIHLYDDYFSSDGYYINPESDNRLAYIRPLNREYRQLIIDRNMALRELDYETFMNLRDVVECDSFVANEALCRVNNALLVQDVEIIDEAKLSTTKEERELCTTDIVDRMLRLSRNLPDSDPKLITSLIEKFNELVKEDYIPLRYKRVRFREKIISFFKAFFSK